jgi:hypothetical protein
MNNFQGCLRLPTLPTHAEFSKNRKIEPDGKEGLEGIRMNNISNIRSQHSLVDLAEQEGWERDREKSSSTVAVLRNDQGGKILVTIGKAGHEIFLDKRNEANQGDIVDFAQWVWSCSFVEALNRLQGKHPSPPSGPKRTALNPSTRGEVDAYAKALAVWKAARSTVNNAYLLGRCLTETTLNDPRFRDRHRLTRRGETLFPHHDRQGLCGLERRGVNLKSFERGTKKGLWYSAGLAQAPAMVICESVIDCLSHSQLFPGDAGYVSFAGEIGNAQRELLTSLLDKAGQRNVQVFVATDNDAKGHEYFKLLSAMPHGMMERMTPHGKDWNLDLIDALKAQ